MTEDIQRQMASNAFELADLREQNIGMAAHNKDLKIKLQSAAHRAAGLLRHCEVARANGRSEVRIDDVLKILGF